MVADETNTFARVCWRAGELERGGERGGEGRESPVILSHMRPDAIAAYEFTVASQ